MFFFSISVCMNFKLYECFFPISVFMNLNFIILLVLNFQFFKFINIKKYIKMQN